jgi:beta-glucanase (GH16 family)
MPLPVSACRAYRLLVILFFLSCKLPDHRQKEKVPEAEAIKANLIWSDEFDQDGLPDHTKWSYNLGGDGWGNQELQFYTSRRAENARVEGGRLIIEARKETFENNKYTSARLLTKGIAEWKYGRFEIKAKLPAGVGTWPAIWLLSGLDPLVWPNDGEIDIMEHVGHDQGVIHSTIHCGKYNHLNGTQKGDTIRVPDCSDKFHIYALDWSEDSIRAYVDDKQYFSFVNEHSGKNAWPFDNRMFLILNIAVGGGWGGQKGVDDTIFPQRMEVDYVRVYQKAP